MCEGESDINMKVKEMCESVIDMNMKVMVRQGAGGDLSCWRSNVADDLGRCRSEMAAISHCSAIFYNALQYRGAISQCSAIFYNALQY